MPIAEIDSDNPFRPAANIGVGAELPHEAFDREREHTRDAELRAAVDTGLDLVRQVFPLDLFAPFSANVLGVVGVNANVAAVR